MNHLLNITKKEIKELLTPGSIISVIVMVGIFMMLGTVLGGEMDGVTSPSRIGLANGDDGGWSDFAVDSVYDFYESTYGLDRDAASEYLIMLNGPHEDGDWIVDAMLENGLDTAFRIMPGFSQNIDNGVQSSIGGYYVFRNGGILGSTSSAVSSTIVSWISNSISHELVSDIISPDTADFLLTPVKTSAPQTYINGEVYEGITPLEISTSVMSQTLMVPVVIMIVIVMIGSIVISSMGSEKENKTLETLLTMPVKRTTIVSGKLIASAVMGLVFGLAYMIGMTFYMGAFTKSAGGINLQDYGLGLGAVDWAIMGAMIFLAIFCALGICMILGAFTKNYKAAQTMTLPISVLAMVPMFLSMFSSFDSLPGVLQAVLFAIPFTHPMTVMNNLMFGNTDLVLAGLAYLLIFTVITIMVTVRIYKSDILLTGIGQTKMWRSSRARGKT
ncbi:MAG: ABC transporter permease [Candidatus Methanoplasma sp.]|jgi:ABC-2 type transport system permease protein|nr:ABC transporter permease [Candidatus Methanoplasma sp.]